MERTEIRLVPVDSVRVSGRHRKDLGDLDDLQRSIEAVGLIHPIVITEDGDLASGERRLETYRRMGRTEIPAIIARDLTDAARLMQAERDENTCRKDFTPTEAVAIGKALTALFAPAAKQRQVEAGKTHGRGRGIACARASTSYSESHTDAPGRTRDKAAKAAGKSRPDYERAEQVMAAAEEEPEKYGDLPAMMDKDGSSWGAYCELRIRRDGVDPRKKQSPSRPQEPKGETPGATDEPAIDSAPSSNYSKPKSQSEIEHEARLAKARESRDQIADQVREAMVQHAEGALSTEGYADDFLESAQKSQAQVLLATLGVSDLGEVIVNAIKSRTEEEQRHLIATINQEVAQ